MKSQKKCYIDKKELCYDKNEENTFKLYQKVKYHCHYTGNFREADHNIRNLRYKKLLWYFIMVQHTTIIL